MYLISDLDNSSWVSLHEYKKSKQQIDSTLLLNEMEKENETISQNIGGNINLMENDVTNNQKELKEDNKKEVKKNIGKNWKDEEEEEEEPEPKVVEPAQKKEIDIQVLTTPDDDYIKKVNENSLVPGVHLSLGNFQKAINLLKSQIKLASIDQLKPLMKHVYLSNQAQFKFIPCLQNNSSFIRDSKSGKMLPSSCITIPCIQTKLNVKLLIIIESF